MSSEKAPWHISQAALMNQTPKHPFRIADAQSGCRTGGLDDMNGNQVTEVGSASDMSTTAGSTPGNHQVEDDTTPSTALATGMKAATASRMSRSDSGLRLQAENVVKSFAKLVRRHEKLGCESPTGDLVRRVLLLDAESQADGQEEEARAALEQEQNALAELRQQLEGIRREVAAEHEALEQRHREELDRLEAHVQELESAKAEAQRRNREEVEATKAELLRRSAAAIEVEKAELRLKRAEELEAVRMELVRKNQEVIEAAKLELQRTRKQAEQAAEVQVAEARKAEMAARQLEAESRSLAETSSQELQKAMESAQKGIESSMHAQQVTEEALRKAKEELGETTMKQQFLEEENRNLKKQQQAAQRATAAELEKKAESGGWFGCCSSVEKPPPTALSPTR